MRTWRLRILREVLRLALSVLHLLAVAHGDDLPISDRPPGTEPRSSAPTRCAPSLGEATETHVSRSTLVGLAMRGLARLAILLGHRQAGNRHWLASQGFSVVLDLEGSSWPTGASTGVQRDSPTDSQDEPRESALGCAAYAWGIAQAGHRHRRNQRGQVPRT